MKIESIGSPPDASLLDRIRYAYHDNIEFAVRKLSLFWVNDWPGRNDCWSLTLHYEDKWSLSLDKHVLLDDDEVLEIGNRFIGFEYSKGGGLWYSYEWPKAKWE